MELMDKHTNHLEELVYDRTRQLHEEKQRDEIEFILKNFVRFLLTSQILFCGVLTVALWR